MAEPVVVLKDVEVVLSRRHVLGPLSLEIAQGEHWALIGPNGSGKTTLLSIVGAERHPMAGSAEVLGKRIGATDLRVLRQSIGVVGHSIADRVPFQVSALEIVLTGKTSLLAPWWGEFSDADRVRASDLLVDLHCGHVAEQAFGHCSQGERQRVLLARSLFGLHPLLLLDEPALGMDLPGREALVQALEGLSKNHHGPTIVQVAHTLEELPTSTSHAMLLRGGLVVASGPVDEVLVDAPLSECFGVSFHVDRSGGRFSARAAGTW